MGSSLILFLEHLLILLGLRSLMPSASCRIRCVRLGGHSLLIPNPDWKPLDGQFIILKVISHGSDGDDLC